MQVKQEKSDREIEQRNETKTDEQTKRDRRKERRRIKETAANNINVRNKGDNPDDKNRIFLDFDFVRHTRSNISANISSAVPKKGVQL